MVPLLEVISHPCPGQQEGSQREALGRSLTPTLSTPTAPADGMLTSTPLPRQRAVSPVSPSGSVHCGGTVLSGKTQ